MPEADHLTEEDRWSTGFEGDRRVVLARLGPYRRLFPRPRHYVKRWHHRVVDLVIEDWEIPLEPLTLGHVCTVTAKLSIRFQPTLAFAREHVEHLDHLGDHIRNQYRALLKDAAEECLRALESVSWLDQGHARLEREIEDLVHELLAIRDIQSRCRCRIEAAFADIDIERLEDDMASADPTRNAIALQILRRRRETLERVAQEKQEQLLLEQRLRLEHQARVLELLKQETALVREQQQEHIQQAREELRADELREAEKIESEVRLRRERLRLEAELKQLELDSSLHEKTQRSANYDEVHEHLKREIELLAMERQRLSLEEEIHKTRLARAKGWILGARKRFTLGQDEDTGVAMEGQITHKPD